MKVEEQFRMKVTWDHHSIATRIENDGEELNHRTNQLEKHEPTAWWTLWLILGWQNVRWPKDMLIYIYMSNRKHSHNKESAAVGSKNSCDVATDPPFHHENFRCSPSEIRIRLLRLFRELFPSINDGKNAPNTQKWPLFFRLNTPWIMDAVHSQMSHSETQRKTGSKCWSEFKRWYPEISPSSMD